MKKVLLAVVAVALSACAPAEQAGLSGSRNTASILGGEPATEQDAFVKSTVSIFDSLQGGACTGTILSKDVIVTAAHCVSSGAAFLHVGFGLKLDKTTAFINSKVAKPNPRYIEAMNELEAIVQKLVESTVPGEERNQKVYEALDSYRNWGDIALIKLKKEIPAGYEPAEVLEDGRYIQNGSQILLAGYGITKPYSEQQPGKNEETILRKVEINVHNAVYSDSEVSFDQTGGKGACHGDSGGPAYVKVGDKLKLFGITSRGLSDPKDTCRQYSGYTYLPAFKAWVSETMAAFDAPPVPSETEQTIASSGQ